jgi:DNA-binding transcriptional LysR family regulator
MRSDHPAVGGLDLDTYLASDHLLVAPLGGAPSGYLDAWLVKRGKARSVRLITHTFGSAAPIVRQTGLIASIPARQAALWAGAEDLVVRDLPFEVPGFTVNVFWSERYQKDHLNIWLRNIVHGAMSGKGEAE